ncbi:hypothetical protein RI054_15g73990 [Pseudoscourfieldia marina]
MAGRGKSLSNLLRTYTYKNSSSGLTRTPSGSAEGGGSSRAQAALSYPSQQLLDDDDDNVSDLDEDDDSLDEEPVEVVHLAPDLPSDDSGGEDEPVVMAKPAAGSKLARRNLSKTTPQQANQKKLNYNAAPAQAAAKAAKQKHGNLTADAPPPPPTKQTKTAQPAKPTIPRKKHAANTAPPPPLDTTASNQKKKTNANATTNKRKRTAAAPAAAAAAAAAVTKDFFDDLSDDGDDVSISDDDGMGNDTVATPTPFSPTQLASKSRMPRKSLKTDQQHHIPNTPSPSEPSPNRAGPPAAALAAAGAAGNNSAAAAAAAAAADDAALYPFEPMVASKPRQTLDSVMRVAKDRKHHAEALRLKEQHAEALATLLGSGIAFVRAARIKEEDISICRQKCEKAVDELTRVLAEKSSSAQRLHSSRSSDVNDEAVARAQVDRRRTDYMRGVDTCASLLLQTADLFEQAQAWWHKSEKAGAQLPLVVSWTQQSLAALGTRCAAQARMHAFRISHNVSLFDASAPRTATTASTSLRNIKARKHAADGLKRMERDRKPMDDKDRDRAAMCLRQLESVQRACVAYSLSDDILTKLARKAREHSSLGGGAPAADAATVASLHDALESIEAIGSQCIGGLRETCTVDTLVDDSTRALKAIQQLAGKAVQNEAVWDA